MKILDHEQGTPEWFAARLGIPTASNFHKVITPSTAKPSKSAAGYMNQLLAEYELGKPLESASTGMMQRGVDMEAEAVLWYELLKDVDVQRVGLCLRDDGKMGASPDGLVGEDGGLEVKSYGPEHMVKCLLGENPAKRTQVQGCIWVCERDWWDELAFNPKMKKVLIRTPRDAPFIAKLSDALDRFLDELQQAREVLDAIGPVGLVKVG